MSPKTVRSCRLIPAFTASVLLMACAAHAAPPLPIIPGAHGFGMETPAGSGRHLPVPKTTIYKVTTLKDSGPGSLREALIAKGPRVVIFEVSGYIDLEGTIVVKNPYLTVAGHTAPWPGIVLRHGQFQIRANNVLIQHIGVRVGDRIGNGYMPHRGCLYITKWARNVIVDHCSTGWGHQCSLSVSGQNCTARHCIISEGWYNAGHNEPAHSKGAFINVSRIQMKQNAAIVGSLFAHNNGRNPDVMQGARAVIANNVMYNFAAVGIKMMHGSTARKPCVLSIVGNVFIPGSDTGGDPGRSHRGKAAWIYLEEPGSQVFLSPDNLMPDGKTYDDPWPQINARRVMYEPKSKPNPKAIVQTPPIAIPGYTVKSARETEAWVLANAGPFPARRNPIDARLVYETRTRTGRGRDDQLDVAGWPELEVNRRELDLPENPNGDADADGYTNLEEWLHAFADEVEGRKGPIPGTDPTLGKRESERCASGTPPDLKPFRQIRRTKGDWVFDATEAKRRQEQAAQEAGLPVARKIDLGGAVAIELVLIPAAEFMMGSKYPPEITKARATNGVTLYRREFPASRVKLTKPYYLAKYEVTQDVWEKVMGVTFKPRGPKGPRLPVQLLTGGRPKRDKHTQYVGTFLDKLNATVGKPAGLTFRLPTEAEWEWACRAGTDTPFWFGETISPKRANYNGAPWRVEPSVAPYRPRGNKGTSLPRRAFMPVGSFAPNPWGLYDTVGNAHELVQDYWRPYPKGDLLADPQYDPGKGIRTIRGGGCNSYPEECRSAYGTYLAVYAVGERAGLRLVAVPTKRN